ncbi:hypothetical protein [Amorphus sp. MBR-141]
MGIFGATDPRVVRTKRDAETGTFKGARKESQRSARHPPPERPAKGVDPPVHPAAVGALFVCAAAPRPDLSHRPQPLDARFFSDYLHRVAFCHREWSHGAIDQAVR